MKTFSCFFCADVGELDKLPGAEKQWICRDCSKSIRAHLNPVPKWETPNERKLEKLPPPPPRIGLVLNCFLTLVPNGKPYPVKTEPKKWLGISRNTRKFAGKISAPGSTPVTKSEKT